MNSRPPPWKTPAPSRKRPSTPLTDAEKATARARAQEAGRRYPNLVDNMWVLRQRQQLLLGEGELSEPPDE